MSWVHDNEILSYVVDLQRDILVLNTIYESESKTEYTDVVFEGVLCHMFEHVLSGSIILDIRDYDILHFFKDDRNQELLTRSKNHAWPVMYDTIEDLRKKLIEEQYKYVVVYSSYGLSGWVIAKNYSINSKNKE